jgi:mRNA-degrading endonuclease RelE of RelBE toxin-antitoxin system
MAYRIDFSEDAERQLKQLSARDQRVILDAIDDNLRFQPDHPTRHRKPLRKNPLAAWELRVGQFRVLYDILEDEVVVAIIVIAKKQGNKFLIEGKEYPL